MSEFVEPTSPRFYGKYRGIVMSNSDPDQSGRIQVKVPSVLGAANGVWADPCLPYADNKAGVYIVPPAGAQVWIDFEEGDPERPVWTGCFWNKQQAPSSSPQDAVIKLGATTITISAAQGAGRMTVKVGDGDGATTLTLTEQGAKIAVKQASLELTADAVALAVGGDRLTVKTGKVEAAGSGGALLTLSGPTIKLNNNALEVT
jgi:uncharacterized protein involved in type VI secretion and phage assembly